MIPAVSTHTPTLDTHVRASPVQVLEPLFIVVVRTATVLFRARVELERHEEAGCGVDVAP